MRRKGWPVIVKSFHANRDAEDRARTTEHESVRGIYRRRTDSERTTVDEALTRHLAEVSPSKGPSSCASDARRAVILREHLGTYSLAALTPTLVAQFRDQQVTTISGHRSMQMLNRYTHLRGEDLGDELDRVLH